MLDVRTHTPSLYAPLFFCLALAGCADEDPGVPPPPLDDPICTGGQMIPVGARIERGCVSNADCSDGIFCNGIEVCRVDESIAAPVVACRCQAAPPETVPCEDERATCDERQKMCLYECMVEPDADKDGVWNIECGGSDCDDNDANRFPGNPEVCDAEGFDEDCDATTFGDIDVDQDGFFSVQCFNRDQSGDVIGGRDCDDGNAGVHPIQNEVCNGVDDDCDGDVDEDVTIELYVDDDGDGFGTGEPVLGCAPMGGYALQGGDCVDKLATIFPGTISCDESDPQFPNRFNKCARDGTWTPGTCDNQRQCIPQPDGTGVCI